MSTFKYTVKEINLEGLDTSKQFKDSDKKLIESFDLTTAFDTSKHFFKKALKISTPNSAKILQFSFGLF